MDIVLVSSSHSHPAPNLYINLHLSPRPCTGAPILWEFAPAPSRHQFVRCVACAPAHLWSSVCIRWTFVTVKYWKWIVIKLGSRANSGADLWLAPALLIFKVFRRRSSGAEGNLRYTCPPLLICTILPQIIIVSFEQLSGKIC